jgi:hypothetical protein
VILGDFVWLTASQREQEINALPGEPATLLDLIIDNIRLEVHNVHIRYEDIISHPEHPFAMGITLSRLVAEATDENWTAK